MEVSGRKAVKCEAFPKSPLCVPCSFNSLHEDALYYCSNCFEFLCGNCTIDHRRSKASRNHKLQDKYAMPSIEMAFGLEEFCPIHNAEIMNYFCNRHTGFCCIVCVTLDHVNCHVRYLTETAESEEYKSLLQTINDLESQVADHIHMANKTNVKQCEHFDQLQASIHQFKTAINVKLGKLDMLIMSEAQQIKNDDFNSLEATLTLLDTIKSGLRDALSNLKNLQKYQRNRQLFIKAKQAQTQVKRYRHELDEISRKSRGIREYTFKPSEDMMFFLNASKLGTLENTRNEDGTIVEKKQMKKGELESDGRLQGRSKQSEKDVKMPTEEIMSFPNSFKLGNLSTKIKVGKIEQKMQIKRGELQSDGCIQGRIKQYEKDVKVPTHSENTKVYTGGVAETTVPHSVRKTCEKTRFTMDRKFVRQINTKHRSDAAIYQLKRNECWITGLELLDCNTLAVADHENKSIKIVDLKSDTIMSCCKLDERPHDLTSIYKFRIVATCDRELVFLQLDTGEFSIEKRLPVEPGCRGIANHRDKLFLTFVGQRPCVRILDLGGKVLHTFANDDAKPKVFIDPQYIAVSTDGRNLFISDCNMHSLTILDMKGNVERTYKHEGLKHPTGLIQDDDGSILVAGNATNNMHRFSPQCSSIQTVMSYIERPQAIAYSGMNNRLYVTRCASNFISVLEVV